MSMPKIPDNINIDRAGAINILIASIGFEELALAHIMNAEGEKIQYILGTLDGSNPDLEDVTICDVLEINRSVEKTLKQVVQTEMLLQYKLDTLLEIGEADFEESADFAFLKTDALTSLGLPGATFSLSRNGIVIKTATSDDTGKVTFTGIKVGTYNLRETITPAGYEENATVYVVVVDDNCNVTIDGVSVEDYIVTNTPL